MKQNCKMLLMMTFSAVFLVLSVFILPKPVSVYADETDEAEIDVTELFDIDGENPTRSPGIVSISAVKLTRAQALMYQMPGAPTLEAGDYRVSLTINNNQGITNDWAFAITCNSNLAPVCNTFGDVIMQQGTANNNMGYETSWDSLTHEIGFYAETGSTSYNGLMFSFYLKKSANTIVNQPIISVYNYTLSSVVHFKGTVSTSVSGKVGDADGTNSISMDDYWTMNTILNAAGYTTVTASNYELYLDSTTRTVVSFAILDADGNGVFNGADLNAVYAYTVANYSLSYTTGQDCSSTAIDSITVYYD